MITFRQAKKDELSQVIELFTNAFESYPYLELALNGQKSRAVNFLMQKINVKAYFRKHKCFVGIEDNQIVTAALLKERKRRHIGLSDFLLVGGISFIVKVGIKRAKDILHVAEQAHKQCKHLGDDTWYLEALAVDINAQGRQLGSRMLNECIIPYIARHEGGILSLITNTEINRKFYMKNGFQEFYEHQLHLNNKSIKNWSYQCKIKGRKLEEQT